MADDDINAILDQWGAKNVDLADALNISPDKVSKSRSGIRRWSAEEVAKIRAFLSRNTNIATEPDLLPSGDEGEYVAIDVLPTYAGMGGGGTGEGSPETALVSRILVEDMLRGRSADFVIINVRGDSMEPDFRHGDQLLIDRRDTSPAQPGPFAVWDGEWGEYVVKNVERLQEGRVRMFSTNPKYSATEVVNDQTRIIGRPVWYGRML